MACEIKLVAVEGIGEGSIACRATLDKQTLPIERNLILVPHYGTLKLEFVTDSVKNIGVSFPLRLLKNVNFQYIPLYRPITGIDKFPEEVEKPRALISHCPSGQVPRTEQENERPPSEDMLAQHRKFKRQMQDLEFTLKKRIIELEHSLDTEARTHHLELAKTRKTLGEAADQSANELEAVTAKFSILTEVVHDIELQRDVSTVDVHQLVEEQKQWQAYLQRVMQATSALVTAEEACKSEYLQRIGDLSQEKQAVEEILFQLTAEHRAGQIELAELRAKHKAFETYVNVLEARTPSSECTELTDLSGFRKLIGKATVHWEDLQHEHHDTSAKHSQTKNQLEEAQQRIAELETQVNSLQGELTAANEASSSLEVSSQAKLQAQEMQLHSLTEDKQRLTRELGSALAAIKEFEQSGDHQQATIANQAATIHSSQETIARLEASLHEAANNLDSLHTDHKQVLRDLQEALEREIRLNDKLVSTANDLEQLTNEHFAISESLALKEVECQERTEELEESERICVQVERELSRVKCEGQMREVEMKSLTLALQTAESERTQLNHSVEHLTQSKFQVETKVAETQNELRQLEAEYQQVQSQLEETQQQLSHARETSSQLQVCLEETTSLKDHTQSSLTHTEDSLAQAHARIQELQVTEEQLSEALARESSLASQLQSTTHTLASTQQALEVAEPYKGLYEEAMTVQATLEQQLAQATAQVEDLTPFVPKCNELTGQVTDLTHKLAEVTLSRDGFAPFKTMYETAHANELLLTEELQTAQQTAAELAPFKPSYEEAKACEAQLEAALKSAHDSLSKSKDKVKALQHVESDLRTALAKVSELTTEVSTLQSRLVTAAETEFKLQTEVSELNLALQSLKESERALTQSLSQESSTTRDLVEKINEKQTALCEAHQQTYRLQTALATTEKELESTQSALKAANEQEVSLRSELGSVANHRDTLTEDLARERSQREDITLKQHQTAGELEETASELRIMQNRVRGLLRTQSELKLCVKAGKAVKRQLARSRAKHEQALAYIQDMWHFKEEATRINEQCSFIRSILDDQDAQINSLNQSLAKASEDKISAYKTLCEVLCNLGTTDKESVDKLLSVYLAAYNYPNNFVKIGDGIYCFGNKKVGICVRNGSLVVRVGGGYMYIEEFLRVHMPPEMEEILDKNSTPVRNFRSKNHFCPESGKKGRREDSENTPEGTGYLSPLLARKSPNHL